jgi:hypothetical protein
MYITGTMTEQESRLQMLRQEAAMVSPSDQAAKADVEQRIRACKDDVVEMDDIDWDGSNRSYRWRALGRDIAYAGGAALAFGAILLGYLLYKGAL